MYVYYRGSHNKTGYNQSCRSAKVEAQHICGGYTEKAVPRKNIFDLLKSSTRGKIALEEFRKDQTIDTRIISDLVVEHEFECSGSYRITTARFLELAAELGAIFQRPDKTITESSQLFFFPYQKSTSFTRTAANAGGVLYEKHSTNSTRK